MMACKTTKYSIPIIPIFIQNLYFIYKYIYIYIEWALNVLSKNQTRQHYPQWLVYCTWTQLWQHEVKKILTVSRAIGINFILTQQLPQVLAAAQAAAQDPLKVVPVARSTEPWHTCVDDLDKGVTGLLTTADQPVGSNPKGDFETGLLRRACARHGKSHFD